MKKKLGLTSLAFVLSLMTLNVFALTCDQAKGLWKGNLGNLNNVRFYLHQPDPMEDANIRFANAATKIEYGLFKGSCKVNADGSLSLDYSRDVFGVMAHFAATIQTPNTMQVSSFTYQDTSSQGSGSGMLGK